LQARQLLTATSGVVQKTDVTNHLIPEVNLKIEALSGWLKETIV
jgi:hypothetical protein